MDLDGDDGAFAWAYGTAGGDIHSDDGFAGIVSLDSVIANVTAGTDALVAAGGVAAITVDAGEYALAWADGPILGTILAGQSAAAFGYSTFILTIDADVNAVAVSAGPILGNYFAGEDLGLASYDSISAGAVAGGDVAWVWSLGDITGTFKADGSIGNLFSYASIDATLVADQPGGTVGSVQALGSILGTFIADTSIGASRSGGAISATMFAPQIEPPVQNDGTMAGQYPLPDVPTSDMASILARAADLRSDLVDAKAEAQAKAQALVDAVSDARGETADAISEHIAAVALSRYDAYVEAVDKLVDAVNRSADDFASDRADGPI